MNTADATRLAGEAYSTRLAHGTPAPSDDKTRIAQEGYQSKLARDSSGAQTIADEFYKIGDKIGDRYEVSAIHHGAMGVVYGCFDHETKLPRALKTVRARYTNDKQVLSMFENEAAVWISLEKHPYIVRAYLVERFKNLPYVITEYVRGPEGMGGDLRGWLGHPRLTLPVAVAMALQIAQGMQHAVRKVPNLVHRDLKPANILVNGDGKAMVTDFGLVQAAQSDAGTPAYMSPEQWRNEVLDARSDIYSYGCILFEVLTARRLFPALTGRDWERAHLASSPAELTSLVPALPIEVDHFVRSCLQKDPAARPQNWDEVVTFFAVWYHRFTGRSVVVDFSSLALDATEWVTASYSLSNLRRYVEVIQACDRALGIDQNNAVAWCHKGGALHELGRSEEAMQAFDRALTANPNFVDAWHNRSVTLLSLGRHVEAIAACDRALTIDPNHVNAWTNKGFTLAALGRYEEALQSDDRALAIDQNNSTAWMNRGNALRNLKRYEQAVQSYDRALSIDPNEAAGWNNRGGTLIVLERYEDALQSYDRAIAIDQHFLGAWYNKGNALYALGRYEETVQAYDQVLAIDNAYVAAWDCKGTALYALGRFEEMVQVYDQLLAINPDDATTWYKKSYALYDLKRYEEVVEACDRALAKDANYVDALNNKGDALRKLKRYKAAIQVYDRVLAINGMDPCALQGRRLATDALTASG